MWCFWAKSTWLVETKPSKRSINFFTNPQLCKATWIQRFENQINTTLQLLRDWLGLSKRLYLPLRAPIHCPTGEEWTWRVHEKQGGQRVEAFRMVVQPTFCFSKLAYNWGSVLRMYSTQVRGVLTIGWSIFGTCQNHSQSIA